MTKGQNRAEIIDVKALLERDEDVLRSAVEALVQAVLEAEISRKPPVSAAVFGGDSMCGGVVHCLYGYG